jgi:predicted alpha/beta-fold hydrolase
MTRPTVDTLVPKSAFVPRRWLSNGHAMTFYAWGRSRTFPELPAPAARLFQVTPDTQVLAQCYWQPSPPDCPTVIGFHGLEASHEAHYMQGLADKAWRRGWNAVLLNQRNCGGTEHLGPGLYHSGLTADPKTVIRELAERDHLPTFGVVGYSLGGNLAVKLAAELEDDAGLPVRAVAAVSPTIDLDRCVRAIERRSNLVYHLNFMRNLRARMRRKAEAWPGAFDLSPLGGIWSIRRFDDVYTAPHHGFAGASDYYARASARRVVHRVHVPTLLVSAEDDPFVPAEQFREPAILDNPAIATRVERHGGHCGFVGDPGNGGDGYWAEETALAFLAAAMRR